MIRSSRWEFRWVLTAEGPWWRATPVEPGFTAMAQTLQRLGYPRAFRNTERPKLRRDRLDLN